MNVASEFLGLSEDELKTLLSGGTLTVYSVARPDAADEPVERSGVLVTFTFATPAFAEDSEPRFVANPATAGAVGTPGFARARTADGKVVADFSAGPGDREIKFSEVSCSPGGPSRIVGFKFAPPSIWPERPEYFDTRPRSGFPMPRT
jgi:hypothetical protein